VIFVQLGVLTQKPELKRERARPGRRFPRPRENLKRTEEFRMSGDMPAPTGWTRGASSHTQSGRVPHLRFFGLTEIACGGFVVHSGAC